jgi:hypothetical protein
MIAAEKSGQIIKDAPDLSMLEAWLKFDSDVATQCAIIACNINMLRRHAPFAYFFANTDATGTLESNFVGRCPAEAEYYSSLKSIDIKSAFWLATPDLLQDTIAHVTAIGSGDIFPFVGYLNEDFYALLCLPDCRSLDVIGNEIHAAADGPAAVRKLLENGGFAVTVTDYRQFRVTTGDLRLAQYFALRSA